MLTIKEVFGQEETRSIYHLYQHCMFQPTAEKFKQKMNAFYSDPNQRMYVCSDNGKRIGVIRICLQKDQSAEIIGIAVDPAFRRQGVGRFMIQHVCTINQLNVLTAETDADSVTFYQHIGFETAPFEKKAYEQTILRFRCAYQRSN